MKGATKLHVLDQVGPLSLIGGNDANLIRLCSSLQQPCSYFLHIGCFSSALTIVLSNHLFYNKETCYML